ncbi:MAG: tRNA pseudouridine(38-40) synthase TruA [Candidatus Cloacimonetes bacterium]|nr:tRNA pseudouridine(38-40) synthase TruA [Candidatus Cloacimonadota bacterium]
MKRLAMLIAYDGSKYFGWQVQKQSPTVQECLEKALSFIAKTEIKVIGAGRTDTGVHALGQVAHFDFPVKMTTEQLRIALKSFIKHSIQVLDIVEVDPDFHSRYDALARTYKYVITFHRTPFNCQYKTSFHRYNLDIEAMKACIPFFLGKNDFTSFSKPNPDITNYIANVYEMTISCSSTYLKNNDLIIEITANRFFHNMIRRIVGALVSVSHKSLKPDVIHEWLKMRKHEQKNYFTAPPNGLYLTKITYPNDVVSFNQDYFGDILNIL